MATISTKYIGELRTKSTHIQSGNEIISDAPLDNFGKGEAFSPTDLLVTSLGTCMVTVMGIVASRHKISIEGAEINITKVMADNPRRVSEIRIELNMPKNNFSENDRELLERTARNCPVARSLHPDLKQVVKFNY